MSEKILNILTQRVSNTALIVTPIISVPDPPSAKPVGCGIFLKIKEKKYLLTSGHLLTVKDRQNLMVPGNENKMVWLKGKFITTYETAKTNNPIDFAVLEFADSQIKHLGGKFDFCNPSNILLNHKTDKKGLYIIAGYPVSGVKKKEEKQSFTQSLLNF